MCIHRRVCASASAPRCMIIALGFQERSRHRRRRYCFMNHDGLYMYIRRQWMMHRTTPANPAIFVLVSRIIVYSVRLHHEPYDRQTDRTACMKLQFVQAKTISLSGNNSGTANLFSAECRGTGTDGSKAASGFGLKSLLCRSLPCS